MGYSCGRTDGGGGTVKTILMLWLIIFKGYGVFRVFDNGSELGEAWAACNSPFDESFSHNGVWAESTSPQDAVYKCWRKARK